MHYLLLCRANLEQAFRLSRTTFVKKECIKFEYVSKLVYCFLGGLRLFSDVWSENAALFERLMEIYSNPPILYYGSAQIWAFTDHKFNHLWNCLPSPNSWKYLCYFVYTKIMTYTCTVLCQTRLCVCVCVCVCAFVVPSNRDVSVTLYIQTGDVLKTGMVPALSVSAIGCKSNVDYFKNEKNLCAPVTSPVISELSYSYTKRSLIACCTS